MPDRDDSSPLSFGSINDPGDAFLPVEDRNPAIEVTRDRAAVFVARARQEHHLKVEGTVDFASKETDIFDMGTVAMAMGTEELRELEFNVSKEQQLSAQRLKWYIKTGEAYCWLTRTWQSVTIGVKGAEPPSSSRAQRSSSSSSKGPTYKVGDKLLVPVPTEGDAAWGTEGFLLCQISAICVVLPKDSRALDKGLISSDDDGPPSGFLEHFTQHVGEVKHPMVFLHLSNLKLGHETVSSNFQGLHSEEQEDLIRPSVVVRLVLNSGLI